jgi:hypothetical protein
MLARCDRKVSRMPPDSTILVTPVGQHEKGRPEPSDVDVWTVSRIAAGTLVFLALVLAALGAIYSYEVPIKTVPQPRLFPSPRVETGERAALRQRLSQQQQVLTRYRWANDQHTLIQIPIERAMALIVAKGPHAYDPVASILGALASPEAGAERGLTPPTSTGPPQ